MEENKSIYVSPCLEACLACSQDLFDPLKSQAGAAFFIIPTYNNNSENIAIFGIQIGIGVYIRFY